MVHRAGPRGPRFYLDLVLIYAGGLAARGLDRTITHTVPTAAAIGYRSRLDVTVTVTGFLEAIDVRWAPLLDDATSDRTRSLWLQNSFALEVSQFIQCHELIDVRRAPPLVDATTADRSVVVFAVSPGDVCG